MSFFKRAWQNLALGGELPAWYTAILMQIRAPAFYTLYAVPDTFDGRFDMLALHVALVYEQVSGDEESVSQVIECFLKDMDRALREQGVSDLGVSRRMRRVGEAFYGRLRAYGAAGADADAWRDALVRNVWRSVPPSDEVVWDFVNYVARARDQISIKVSGLDGMTIWPNPIKTE